MPAPVEFPHIVFVDDEEFFATKYIQHLERVYRVTYRDSAMDAFKLLQQQDVKFAGVVLDVMMPSPKGSEGQTANGLDTGLWFVEKCRDELGTWPFGVMMLTNRNPQDIRNALDAKRFLPRHVGVRHKLETPAFAFPEILKEHLRGA